MSWFSGQNVCKECKACKKSTPYFGKISNDIISTDRVIVPLLFFFRATFKHLYNKKDKISENVITL